MADFALYSALSGRKDWSQVRQDRQNEIVMQRQMQADLQARIDKEAQARAGVVEYMNQLNNASVLEQDLERVKGVEAEQRKKIVEGLKKAGNNYNKYLLGAGAGELNNYYQNVMKSEEMQGAINNKLVNAQYQLDNYLGRKSRPTQITLPDGTVREASMQEQMDLFNRGEITKLNYAGSVQPTDPIKVYDYISKTYGKDKYTRQKAERGDIVNYAKAMGAEDWEAQQIADNYDNELASGATPVYFKNEEASVDYNQLISKEKYRRMIAGEDENGGATGVVDLVGDLFFGDLASPSFAGNPLEYKVEFDGKNGVATAYEAKNLGTEFLGKMLNVEGFTIDKEKGTLKIPEGGSKDIYYVPLEGKDAPIVKGKVTSDDIIYEPESFVRMQVSENGKEQTRTFIKAKAVIETAKRLPDGDYWTGGTDESNYGQDNRTTKIGSRFKDNDYQSTILIPVDYDAKKYAPVNKQFGVTGKQQSVAGASADIDVWAKQNAQKAVAQGEMPTVLNTNVAIQDPQYAQYAEQIKANPQGYMQQFAQINIGDLVTKAAEANNVSPQELNALFTIESGYNPMAVSSAGAMGVGQLMPSTSKDLGVKNPFDPTENIMASAEYFGDLRSRYKEYNDPNLAVAAYNWGLGNVDKAVAKFGENWVTGANNGFFDDKGNWVQMPKETNNYIAKFSGALGY